MFAAFSQLVAGALSAPSNTVAPAVTGTATVGQTLSSTTGTWVGSPAPTFAYQWQRAGSNISGATSSTYVLVSADASNTIRCVVTGTNVVSAVSANSNSTASVAAKVPNAPTIGTATATAYNTATVTFTAPAENGGATITSYTATSSPSGITGTLSQAGSGTITVSGLAAITSYTFTVTATNSVGTSAASAASNSITTSTQPGQSEYLTAGTYTWTAPTGVTSISVVAVGSGHGGGTGGAAGGALAYKNNITVTPGANYTVIVGSAGSGIGFSNNGYGCRGNPTTLNAASNPSVAIIFAQGGRRNSDTPSYAKYTGAITQADFNNNFGAQTVNADGGGLGSAATPGDNWGSPDNCGPGLYGGGGAGGYAGNGGVASSTYYKNGQSGGGGGGGGSGQGVGSDHVAGSSGGGTGMHGQFLSGGGGSSSTTSGAGGGGVGSNFSATGDAGGSSGCSYPGGGGYWNWCGTNNVGYGFAGKPGGLRIIYPGSTRQYPSTCASDK